MLDRSKKWWQTLNPGGVNTGGGRAARRARGAKCAADARRRGRAARRGAGAVGHDAPRGLHTGWISFGRLAPAHALRRLFHARLFAGQYPFPRKKLVNDNIVDFQSEHRRYAGESTHVCVIDTSVSKGEQRSRPDVFLHCNFCIRVLCSAQSWFRVKSLSAAVPRRRAGRRAEFIVRLYRYKTGKWSHDGDHFLYCFSVEVVRERTAAAGDRLAPRSSRLPLLGK